MGYSTDFTGQFEFDKPLDPETLALLVGLNVTRRMKRQGLDPKYGVDGEFYFNPQTTQMGQEREASIVDFNSPPKTQPGLWNHWEVAVVEASPGVAKTVLQWDRSEKFYSYVEWLQYLIDKIIKPRDYVLNGTVEWIGEDLDDRGQIVVIDNKVTTKKGRVVYD